MLTFILLLVGVIGGRDQIVAPKKQVGVDPLESSSQIMTERFAESLLLFIKMW